MVNSYKNEIGIEFHDEALPEENNSMWNISNNTYSSIYRSDKDIYPKAPTAV